VIHGIASEVGSSGISPAGGVKINVTVSTHLYLLANYIWKGCGINSIVSSPPRLDD
jgi:hypothetical protein